MAVPVTFLSEALIAILAHERSQTTMHANVVHDIAEFCEGISTSDAHQKLIWAARIFVLCEQLHVASLNFIAIAFLI